MDVTVVTAWPEEFLKSFWKDLVSFPEWKDVNQRYLTLTADALKGRAYYEPLVVEGKHEVCFHLRRPPDSSGQPALDFDTKAAYCGALTILLLRLSLEEVSVLAIKPAKRPKAQAA